MSADETRRRRTIGLGGDGSGGNSADLRFQVLVGLGGFLGGLAVVVPVVIWLAGGQGAPVPPKAPATLAEAVAASAVRQPPGLVDAPARAARSQAKTPTEGDATAATGERLAEALATARSLIAAGDVEGARRVLAEPTLAEDGRALFMLAETYDPTVLATLGMPGLVAEPLTARRYYEAALARGVAAAERRLEALR